MRMELRLESEVGVEQALQRARSEDAWEAAYFPNPSQSNARRSSAHNTHTSNRKATESATMERSVIWERLAGQRNSSLKRDSQVSEEHGSKSAGRFLAELHDTGGEQKMQPLGKRVG